MPARGPALLLLSTLLLRARGAGGNAAAAEGCSRERPCENFGTCELHTGACACPLGFGGRTCGTVLLPACAVTREAPAWGPAPPSMLCSSGAGAPEHGQEGTKSCECLRQCVQHEGGGLGVHGFCFERPGGPAEQHSAFPAAEEPGVVYRPSSDPGRAGEPPLTREAYITLQRQRNRLEQFEARQRKRLPRGTRRPHSGAGASGQRARLRARCGPLTRAYPHRPTPGARAGAAAVGVRARVQRRGHLPPRAERRAPHAVLVRLRLHGRRVRGARPARVPERLRGARPLPARLLQLRGGLVWHRLLY